MSSPTSRKPSAKPAAKAAGPGRPKDLGKRAAILEAAKALFIEQGYTGVSMDTIAAQAGVSKLTVYSHFGDKETLFSEAVQSKCIEMLPDALFVADADGPLRDQLIGIGLAFFELITSDAAISIQRMMMAPETDERLRELFWQAGPERTCEALADFLRARRTRRAGHPRLLPGRPAVPDSGQGRSAHAYDVRHATVTGGVRPSCPCDRQHRLLPARLCAARGRYG